MILCGHNYCKKCITDIWDQDDQKGIYRCPVCKQSFTPRPVLGKNMMVAEMVEKLKTTRLQATPLPASSADPPADPPASVHTGSGGVQCDSCTEIKQKAVKSCLECRSSYCQNHLEQHESLFKGKKHNLMDATGQLQEMICPRHDKILEIYCRTDQQCICMLCLVDEHKNHDTVSTATARTEKQVSFPSNGNPFDHIHGHLIKNRLTNAVPELSMSSDQDFYQTSEFWAMLIFSYRLEKEVNELRRKDAELKQLSETQDHSLCLCLCLQSLSSATVSLSGSTDGYSVSPHLSFDDVMKSVFQLRDKLQQFCRETEKITETDFHPFTLDSNTIYSSLRLSEDNTVITSTSCNYRYPNHPDRFDYWIEALCTESVSGRCYWEVEYGGNEGVHIAVAYKSIKRKGKSGDSRFGYNDQSWRLYCCNSSCSFRHNTIRTVLPVVSSRKIEVYVDHSAGMLSFLSVSDTISLIHRVQTTFTQPLYPGIGLQNKTTVKLSPGARARSSLLAALICFVFVSEYIIS
uniref:Uncharacterized protein n=1 Tax=Sinocyclocheilus grahami TaxID=75366 RepID=A0A672RM06_SINGR